MLLIQERGHKNICSCFITLTGKFHHFRVFFDFFLKNAENGIQCGIFHFHYKARVTLFRKNMCTKLIENSPLQETLNLH